MVKNFWLIIPTLLTFNKEAKAKTFLRILDRCQYGFLVVHVCLKK